MYLWMGYLQSNESVFHVSYYEHVGSLGGQPGCPEGQLGIE